MLNRLDFGIFIGYVLLVISVGCGSALVSEKNSSFLN
jgi:hypothetical protein